MVQNLIDMFCGLLFVACRLHAFFSVCLLRRDTLCESDELSSQHKLVEHTELLTLTARCEWYKDEVAFRQERRDSNTGPFVAR